MWLDLFEGCVWRISPMSQMLLSDVGVNVKDYTYKTLVVVLASNPLGRPSRLLSSPTKDVATVLIKLSPAEAFETAAQTGIEKAFASWQHVRLIKFLPQVSRPEDCLYAVGKPCRNIKQVFGKHNSEYKVDRFCSSLSLSLFLEIKQCQLF